MSPPAPPRLKSPAEIPALTQDDPHHAAQLDQEGPHHEAKQHPVQGQAQAEQAFAQEAGTDRP